MAFKGLRSAWGEEDPEEQGFAEEEAAYGSVGEGARLENIIERGAEEILQQVAPSAVIYDESYFRLDDAYCRVIYLQGWPVDVEPNWLRELFQWPRAMDISIYYQPLPMKPLLNKLRGKSARESAEIDKDSAEGNAPDFERMQRLEDAMELQNMLQRGETKPFQVSLQVMIRATSLRELNELTQQVEKTLAARGGNMRCATLRQRDAMLSVMPFGRNYISDSYTTRNMHTHAAMYTFPLANADLSHPSGIWYGVNQMTNSNVILDRFQLQSPHALVLGASGSGKSYAIKLEGLRALMRNHPVMVIDPEGEFERMCEQVGGQFITVSPSSADRINALDFSAIADGIEDQLTSKIMSALKLVGSMMNPGGEGYGLNAEQVQILEALLRAMYADFGYTQDPRTQILERDGGYCSAERMPVFSDFRARVQRHLDDYEHDAQIQAMLRPVVAALGPYCAGGMFSGLFDQKTTVDLRAQMVVFNIRELTKDEQLMRLGMHTVLDFLWNTVMNRQQMLSGQPRFLYIDEAHVMMRSPESAQFLEDLLRRARKFNVACTVISQSPEDFLRPDRPQGRAIFDNSSMQIVMRLKRRALEMLQDLMGLDDQEVDLLATRDTGEGMVFAMNDRVWLSMRTASPYEHSMITTNPAEVAQIEAQRRRLEGESPHLTLSGGKLALPAPAMPDGEEEPQRGVMRRPQLNPPAATSQIGGELPVREALRRNGPPKPLSGSNEASFKPPATRPPRP
jgi:hypothetical protein